MPTAAEGRVLVDAALAAGVVLCVYQNRRWDADIVTLANLINTDQLGRPWRVLSRMDQDNPSALKPGPGNGLLLDLGSHVIDQMLWLLGPATSVSARIAWLDVPDGRIDCAFALELEHASGATSCVESSKVHHVSARDLRAYGDKGCFSLTSSDIQEKLVKAGRRPIDDPTAWGYEPPRQWGTLHTSAGQRVIPSEQGRWPDFYTQFAAAVRGEGPPPVPAEEAVRTLDVVEAAKVSAAAGSTVPIVAASAATTDRV